MEDIIKIHNAVKKFVEGGFLDKAWYYIKDIKNFEIQIYLDPFCTDIDEKFFNEYTSIYEYEDDYGTLIGRLKYDGYYHIGDEHLNIEIFRKINDEKYRLIEKDINRHRIQKARKHWIKSEEDYAKGLTRFRFGREPYVYELYKYEIKKYDYSNYSFNECIEQTALYKIQDVYFFFKCNESVFLIMDKIIYVNDDGYSNYIEQMKSTLETNEFNSYLNFVGKCNIDGYPIRAKIFGCDIDEFDALIDSAKVVFSKGLIEEYNERLSETSLNIKIEKFIKSLHEELAEVGIRFAEREISISDLDNLFTRIEDFFGDIFRKNYNIIIDIINKMDPKIYGDKSPSIISKIKSFGKRFEARGLSSICVFIYDIILLNVVQQSKNKAIINEIKSYRPSLVFATELRNHNFHKSSKDEGILVNGISVCLKFFKSLRLLDQLLNQTKND